MRISLLVFQVVWLNAVLPGHTRGVIALGGAQSCHEAKATRCCPGKKEKAPAPKPEKSAKCAVCVHAARMTPPPVIDLTPPPLELAGTEQWPAPAVCECEPFPPAYFGRAPPLV